jgi:hypothetical protein
MRGVIWGKAIPFFYQTGVFIDGCSLLGVLALLSDG